MRKNLPYRFNLDCAQVASDRSVDTAYQCFAGPTTEIKFAWTFVFLLQAAVSLRKRTALHLGYKGNFIENRYYSSLPQRKTRLRQSNRFSF
jgi:hypothetical protein